MAEAKRASDEVKRKREKVQGELADVRKRLDENPEMELVSEGILLEVRWRCNFEARFLGFAFHEDEWNT